MTEQLTRRATLGGELDIKPANKMRGKPFHDHAVTFSQAFGIGDALTPEKFDQWAHANGYLVVPVGVSKRSDVWLAHLQRRHQLRYSINKAAMHPRMREENRTPFIIDHAGPNLWEVRSVVDAINQDATARKLARLAVVQKRKLLYLQQSEDFVQLPPYLRMAVTDISADIESALQKTALEARDLERRIDRITERVRAAIESGEIKPSNGGIAGLLEESSSEFR
jgi:hypothetical protein